jgi:hypothetical protein
VLIPRAPIVLLLYQLAPQQHRVAPLAPNSYSYGSITILVFEWRRKRSCERHKCWYRVLLVLLLHQLAPQHHTEWRPWRLTATDLVYYPRNRASVGGACASWRGGGGEGGSASQWGSQLPSGRRRGETLSDARVRALVNTPIHPVSLYLYFYVHSWFSLAPSECIVKWQNWIRKCFITYVTFICDLCLYCLSTLGSTVLFDLWSGGSENILS